MAFSISTSKYQITHQYQPWHLSLSEFSRCQKLRDEYLSLLVKGIDPQAKVAQQVEQAKIAEESHFINVAKNGLSLSKRALPPITQKISGASSKPFGD